MAFDPGTARQAAASFDLKELPEDFYSNPFPYYHALREHAPVKQLPDGGYFLTRYSDVDFVYKNPKLFSSDKKKEFKPKYGDSLLYEHHTTSLVFNDPPLHTRVRRLIAGALTPRAIAEMQPGLVALVDRLLDAMAAKGHVDLIEDFAAAIPVEIIGNLLGVPHEGRDPLRGWSLAILGALEPVVTPEAFERGNRAVQDFIVYLEGLIGNRRANPGNPERDVLTRLIQGEDDRRALDRQGAPAQLHLPAERRTRDDHQSDRQRSRRAARASAREGEARRATGAHQDRDRGDPALRELQSARQPHYHPAGGSRRRANAG